jgi:hypothetical protein
MNKYFFSFLFQSPEEVEFIDSLDDDNCQKVVEIYESRIFDEDENNVTDYEPYIGKFDYFVDSHKGWTLVKNDGCVWPLYALQEKRQKTKWNG